MMMSLNFTPRCCTHKQVDEAGRELQSFSEQQTAKLKQLQRLVAEMVVEKNEEVSFTCISLVM